MRSLRLSVLAVIAAVAVAVACGSMDDEASGGPGGDAGSSADAGGYPTTTPFGDGGATSAATGVLLLHAAAFPAFRVCFSNYLDLPPQPDSKAMPAANLVGVDVGAVVRVGAMTNAPGIVYVFDQSQVQATPHDPNDQSCRKLLANSLYRKGFEYLIAGTINEPVGVTQATVLAITGCGNVTFLNSVGIPRTDCADYDQTAESEGNLQARLLRLQTTNTSTLSTLPVQLVSLSTELAKQAAPGQQLDVSFGDFDAGPGPLEQSVASSLELYDASAPVTLAVDQATESTFGTHGFRIAYRSADGSDAGPSFALDQSLASVQQVSRPDSNPTSYFLTPSNYALLLLGDPRVAAKFDDGGVNPGFDARRAVHILAVPVRDEIDAGSLGGNAGAAAAPADAAADAP